MSGRRTVLLVGAVLGCLTVPACTGSSSSMPTDSPAPAPVAAGEYVVDGMTVHLDCAGDGPTTVLLLPGGRDAGSDYDGLVDLLGEEVRTCTFEYPGAGDAPPIEEPMTPEVVAATLQGALAAAQEPAPYVVVGHSLAGLSLRVYVGEHGADVAGVVLFDPTPVETVAGDPGELEEALDWDAVATIAQASAVTAWPDVPVDVLESDPAVEGRSVSDERRWHDGQLVLAALSAQGRHRIVRGAGHFVFMDAPDTAAAAVRRVLQLVG